MASFSRFSNPDRVTLNSVSLLLCLFPEGSQWLDTTGSRVACRWLTHRNEARGIVWC